MRGTVANRLTAVNFADLHNSALQSNDLVHRVGAARLRIDPVERGTGTYEIVVKRGPEEYPGGRREACRKMRRLGSRRDKAPKLEIVQRVLGFVRAREMADESPPADRTRL